MQKVFDFMDGIGEFFSALASRIERILDKKNKVRFLWLLIGFLFAFGVADNRTAVVKIWEASTGGGLQFNAAGELVEASINGVLVWFASLVLTIFFWVCEANFILGIREPKEAHERFQEANRFRVAAPSDNAPDAAEHYHRALMHGELFDIRVAKAVGVIAFAFDIVIQWQNRYWGGSSADMMISAGYASLMLVGTELLMVLIRVVQGTSYPDPETSRI